MPPPLEDVMEYLQSYGGLWKLSNAAYKKFLDDVSHGKTWDLNSYGKMISGSLHNVTDITALDAKEMLLDV